MRIRQTGNSCLLKQKGNQNVNEGEKMQKVRFFEVLIFFRVRRCAFSLKSRVIQPSDRFEPRRKVVLRGEDNTWTPILRSFDKVHEVGVSSYLFYS